MSMKDETRKPLKPNTRLMISVNNNTRLEIVIGEAISYGGSCIAYEGMLVFNDNRPVIIKECYPSSQSIERDETTGELIISDQMWFNQRKEMFKKGVSRASRLFSEILVKDIFVYGDCEETNTVYGISLKGDGCILKELVERETLSISKMAGIMASLCEAIAEIHKRGFIYLDIKPENIYCCTNDNNKVQLFDFDSCIADSEAHNHARMISYSNGWAAPEQLPNVMQKESFYVSKKSDIFAIGACFYWLLSGEKPYTIGNCSNNEPDFLTIENIEKGVFDLRNHFKICRHADKVVIKRVETILKGTLSYNPKNREYSKVLDVRDEFIELLRVSSVESRQDRTLPVKKQNINRFNYDSDLVDFYGRHEELSYLVSMCEDETVFCWSGICGEAGSGKTRLAYELCKEMEKREWQIFWPCHAKSCITRIDRYIDSMRRDTLICFDDANTDSEIIGDIIRDYVENRCQSDCKLRIVLIDRSQDESAAEFKEFLDYAYNKQQLLGYNYLIKGFIMLNDCPIEDIVKLVKSYAKNLYSVVIDEQGIQSIIDALRSFKVALNPLYALFTADAWCRGERPYSVEFNQSKAYIVKWDRFYALESIKTRELERIEMICRDAAESRLKSSLLSDSVKKILFVSYFFYGLDIQVVKELIPNGIELTEVTWIFDRIGLYNSDNNSLKQIQPDLVAEYFCLEILNSMSKSDAKRYVRFLLDRDFKLVFAGMAKIEKDYDELVISSPNYAPFHEIYNVCFDKITELTIYSMSTQQLKEFNELLDKGVEDLSCFAEVIKNTDIENEIKILNAIQETEKWYSDNKENMYTDGERAFDNGIYYGEMVFLKKCGKGKLVANNGRIYNGEWNMDVLNGKGTVSINDRIIYDGEWKNNKPDGYGIMHSQNGWVYSGYWAEAKMNGKGKIRYKNGIEYDGEWKEGIRYGYGSMVWPNGDKYIGEWNNVRNGYGIHYYNNHDVYEGDWKDDKCHGFGKKTFADGSVIEGVWDKGVFTSNP